MAEESKLVAETTESTETQEKFNPLAFTTDNYVAEKETEVTEESNEETESTEATETETKEENETTEEKEQGEQEEGFSWDSVKVEEENKNEEEVYNWDQEDVDETKEKIETNELDWEKVSKELNLEAKSKDELLEIINGFANQTPVADTSQVAELRRYLSFNDRDLVAEELKADGMDAGEIEESLDKLEDAGMIKIKAKSIRRVINNAIETQTAQTKKQAEAEQKQRKEGAAKAKKELQNTIKNMNEFMGGKVTKKQKVEVYKYATGKMMNDIYSSHANVADVAMFMLYRKQIEKILRSQGLEDGKAAIMDSIVSPSLNTGKGKPKYKIKDGAFDPKAFMGK